LRAIVFDTGSQKKEKKKKTNSQVDLKPEGNLTKIASIPLSLVTRRQWEGRKIFFFSPGCAIQPGIEKVLLPAASSTFTVAMGQ
jgi:hypothetical protein